MVQEAIRKSLKMTQLQNRSTSGSGTANFIYKCFVSTSKLYLTTEEMSGEAQAYSRLDVIPFTHQIIAKH